MSGSNGKDVARRNGVVPRRARAVDSVIGDDELSQLITETEYITRWYTYAVLKRPEALELYTMVPGDVFTKEFFREAYEYVGDMIAKGEPADGMLVDVHLGRLAKTMGESAANLHGYLTKAAYQDASDPEEVRHYGRALIRSHRGRSQVDIINGAAQLTREAMSPASELTVRQVADDVIERLLHLHSRMAEVNVPVTQSAIVQHLLTRVTKEGTPGVEWPWEPLQKLLGVVPPGRVVGLTGFSGNGKTLFIVNLFLSWVLRGVPVIVFPTEMELGFLERVAAVLSRVPKEFAEEGDWRTATEEQMERYRDAMKSLVGLPWDIVQESEISPQEIMVRIKALRRKYRGKQVVVIVDHMHRLEYPNGVNADDSQGASLATKHFKNMALKDKDGGLSFMLLYQPKKPEEEAKQYRPVLMSSVRGHGGAPNELDVHMTIWRRVVKTTHAKRTAWGTPRALFAKETDLMPAAGNWGDEDTKLDDEHVYIMHDKHRIRGAKLDVVMLNFHTPSGFIYDQDWLAGVDNEQQLIGGGNGDRG